MYRPEQWVVIKGSALGYSRPYLTEVSQYQLMLPFGHLNINVVIFHFY